MAPGIGASQSNDGVNMQIIPLPAFRDNYIWLLRVGAHAVVVDRAKPRRCSATSPTKA
jgi:glyoxylase-like metal-dependent hydrolase (beta-lactamase superfamily II)